MMKISQLDSLYTIYLDGKKAIQNKNKRPPIANPYVEGTDAFKAYEQGMEDQNNEG